MIPSSNLISPFSVTTEYRSPVGLEWKFVVDVGTFGKVDATWNATFGFWKDVGGTPVSQGGVIFVAGEVWLNFGDGLEGVSFDAGTNTYTILQDLELAPETDYWVDTAGANSTLVPELAPFNNPWMITQYPGQYLDPGEGFLGKDKRRLEHKISSGSYTIDLKYFSIKQLFPDLWHDSSWSGDGAPGTLGFPTQRECELLPQTNICGEPVTDAACPSQVPNKSGGVARFGGHMKVAIISNVPISILYSTGNNITLKEWFEDGGHIIYQSRGWNINEDCVGLNRDGLSAITGGTYFPETIHGTHAAAFPEDSTKPFTGAGNNKWNVLQNDLTNVTELVIKLYAASGLHLPDLYLDATGVNSHGTFDNPGGLQEPGGIDAAPIGLGGILTGSGVGGVEPLIEMWE